MLPPCLRACLLGLTHRHPARHPPHRTNQRQVERSVSIKVSFQDVRGKAKTKKFRDWEARIFQHEYDHLDGVVYVDRLSPEGRARVGRRVGAARQQSVSQSVSGWVGERGTGWVVVCVCVCVCEINV